MVQMHQRIADDVPIGGGANNDREYTTWELKVCPSCGREVLEHYTAVLVDGVTDGTALAEKLNKTIHE